MIPIPSQIDGASVVCYTRIDHRHRFTGNTRQIVGGRLIGALAGLAICQYQEESAFYLFGCDCDWKVVTDTWHQNIEDAKAQAEFEYEGVEKTWIFVN